MASIFKIDNEDAIGRIESNGFVYDDGGEYLGKVVDGRVYDKTGEYIGYVDDEGLVWDTSNKQLGKVRDDGKVLDVADNELADVESPHMEFGGAAYLLLFR